MKLVRNEPVYILFIGIDRLQDTSRADVIILAGIKDSIELLHIPRDTIIMGERLVNNFAFNYKRKNISGFINAIKTIHGDIDGYIVFNYDNFIELIDAIGGVRVKILEPMSYHDTAQNLHIEFSTGSYTLKGEQALKFVRYRKNMDDISRIYKEIGFLRDVFSKLKNPLNVMKVVFKGIPFRVESDLSHFDMLSIFYRFKNFDFNIRSILLKGYPLRGGGYKIAERHTFFNEVQNLDPYKRKRVCVWNASGKKGVAYKIRKVLIKRGYDVWRWGNYRDRLPYSYIVERIPEASAAEISSIFNVSRIVADYIDTDYGIEFVVGSDIDEQVIDKMIK